MRALIVIPSRYAAVRFPGKPLAQLGSRPMIQWVYEGVRQTPHVSKVVIATEDTRIQKAAESFGAEVLMTSSSIESGTDRVAAVARDPNFAAEIYVNVQGDEPMMRPEIISPALELVRSGRFEMATAMCPLLNQTELLDPNVVKVVADSQDRALYFSRHPIPYSRLSAPGPGQEYVSRRHLGLYVYTRDALLKFSETAPTALERAEGLEQLRAMHCGIAIGIKEVEFESIGVDTPENLVEVSKKLGVSK